MVTRPPMAIIPNEDSLSFFKLETLLTFLLRYIIHQSKIKKKSLIWRFEEPPPLVCVCVYSLSLSVSQRGGDTDKERATDYIIYILGIFRVY
jgi:hypothetical protein